MSAPEQQPGDGYWRPDQAAPEQQPGDGNWRPDPAAPEQQPGDGYWRPDPADVWRVRFPCRNPLRIKEDTLMFTHQKSLGGPSESPPHKLQCVAGGCRILIRSERST